MLRGILIVVLILSACETGTREAEEEVLDEEVEMVDDAEDADDADDADTDEIEYPGDSLPYPKVSVEQLDREMDEYRNSRLHKSISELP